MIDATLYVTKDVIVRSATGGGGGLAYVTFASYVDHQTLDRKAFGEDFLRSRNIDAVHILSRDNRWYQYPEWPEALAAAAAATAHYDMVVAYGSSMGGYAALHYGAACGASVGIALSPQYSVDPEIVPFEDRWVRDVASISFRNDTTSALPKQYILYDPNEPNDRLHFDLYAARSPTIGIRIPHGGHPVGAFLAESKMFAQLFEGIHTDTLDPLAFERRLRERRRHSAQYFFTLSRRIPHVRIRQKIALARLAVDASPRGAPYNSNLAIGLDAAGLSIEARRYHHRAIALEPGNYHVALALVLHHEQLGELRTAGRLVARLADRYPSIAPIRQSNIRIRRRKRHAYWLGRLIRDLGLDVRLDRLLDGLEARLRRKSRRLRL